MLFVRGVLPQPGYKDKPVRGVANKAGGGRTKRKTMRGSEAASSALQQPVFDESADPVAYDEDFPSYPEEEEVPLELENARNQILADLREEERAQERRDFERNIGMVEPDLNSEEEDEIRRRYFGPLGDDIE